MIEPIKITGLSEFTRNLKRFDANLPKAIRIAGNEAANIVVDEAKSRVPTGPGRRGHAKTSIKAKSTQSLVRVSGGGKKFPYYPWLDFGGRVGRNRSVLRPFIKEGRYIWAAFGDNRERVQKKLTESLIDVGRLSGVDVDR